MYRFYRVYALLLLPFYAACLIIGKQSVMKFNENATLKLKLGGVSIEAYFYLMGMLLMSVYLFELFKDKKLTANGLTYLPTPNNSLALRNGQDKPQIWVAYKGLIYDVTESRLWRNGKHYEHWAGQDLTDEFADAPHTETVFEKFMAIGRLLV